MLQHPQCQEPLRVLGIDPGSSSLGVGLITTLGDNHNRTVAWADTIHIDNRAVGADLHGPRLSRIHHIGEALRSVIDYHHPHVIIAESPFMSRLPQAFKALTEVLLTIQQVAWDYDPTLPLFTVPPVPVKNNVGLTKKHELQDKEAVRRQLNHDTTLDWALPSHTLDEHAIDAIAVGLFYVDHYVIMR